MATIIIKTNLASPPTKNKKLKYSDPFVLIRNPFNGSKINHKNFLKNLRSDKNRFYFDRIQFFLSCKVLNDFAEKLPFHCQIKFFNFFFVQPLLQKNWFSHKNKNILASGLDWNDQSCPFLPGSIKIICSWNSKRSI